MELEFTPEGRWSKSEAEFEADMEMIEITAQIEADEEQIPGQMDFFGRTIGLYDEKREC